MVNKLPSVCHWWLAQRVSKRYSISAQVLPRISLGMVKITSWTLVFSAFIPSSGTISFIYNQNKNSIGVISGERGGQALKLWDHFHQNNGQLYTKSLLLLDECVGAPIFLKKYPWLEQFWCCMNRWSISRKLGKMRSWQSMVKFWLILGQNLNIVSAIPTY